MGLPALPYCFLFVIIVIRSSLNTGRITWKYGTGFPLQIGVMNNLLLTKKVIKKAKMLHAAQIAATKNGMLISYRRSAFEERQKQAREEVVLIDS